jgi:2-amino-4-hydroxy-6-hydroxymethyldihydropteridine diphosphokinase
MNDLHTVYLSLGSDILPEVHLRQAIQMLRGQGRVEAISGVWQSHAVGSDGPDFLNACAQFLSGLQPDDLKEQILRPIESKLGRVRSADKNAPRTIDLDLVLCDGTPLNIEFWAYAFVIVPLAELIPDFIHPVSGEPLSKAAEQIQRQTWIVRREDVPIS